MFIANNIIDTSYKNIIHIYLNAHIRIAVCVIGSNNRCCKCIIFSIKLKLRPGRI